MKVLVYGAGPLGSLFAARLHEAGHQTSILARGKRLEELRENGIILEEGLTGKREIHHVPVVEKLQPDDAYDLILVIMRSNRAVEILPALAANSYTPTVVFLMNNAAGPGQWVEALGADRVMVGFPVSGGYRAGDAIRYLGGTEKKPATIPIGEVDGGVRPRTLQVAAVLSSMRGYIVEIHSDMDAWLKSHVAILMPGLAAALYGANTDNTRLAETRDLLVLAARATKESLNVLDALGIPVTPARLRVYQWIPEPLLVWLIGRLLKREEIQVALAGHASAARDEIFHLVESFRILAQQSGVPTPASDLLYPFLSPEQPSVPAGSKHIPMNWRGVTLLSASVGGLLSTLALGFYLARRKKE